MKVSIIVPVYNTELYLERCVNSLCEQSYKNIEICLIDDGSTDNSARICDSLSLKDNRIKVIHKKNQGVSIARKCGIEMSTGDYIAFVDSDDWVAPTLISECLDVVLSTESDIVIYNYKKTNSSNGIDDVKKSIGFPDEKKVQSSQVFRNIFYGRMGWNIWQLFVRRDLFKGIVHPEGIKIGEDLYLVYQLIGRSNNISYTNTILYYYYQRQGSAISNLQFGKKLDDSFKDIKLVTKSFEKYIHDNYSNLEVDFDYFIMNRDFTHLLDAIIATNDNEINMSFWIKYFKNDFSMRYNRTSIGNLKIMIKYLILNIPLIMVPRFASTLRSKLN